MSGIAFPGVAYRGIANGGIARSGIAGAGLGFVGARAPGPTFYFDPAGSDSNDGLSPNTPWQTIAKFNAQTWLVPNTRALFKGGQTFTGVLTPNNGLSPLSPLVIGSYGTGRATINTTGHGCFIQNKAGITVRDLIFTGSAAASTCGVLCSNNQAGNTKLNGLTLLNLTMSGFTTGAGIEIGGDNGNSGFSNVLIQGCIVSGCATGIDSYGSGAAGTNSHVNVTVRNCIAHDNTLNGIVLGQVNVGLIETCTAYANGSASLVGPIGIWCYDSTSVVTQFCESYGNLTGNTADGGGFDIDGGCVNCIMQYNFSHGNKGAGFLVFAYSGGAAVTGSIVRYNISETDGEVNASYGAITVGTGGPAVTGTLVYGNTFFQSRATRSVVCIQAGMTGRFFNNIFYSTNGAKLIDTVAANPTGMLFTGNEYWNTGAFSLRWNNITHASFAAWQTATNQEKISGNDVHLAVDPLLVAPLGGTAASYKLQAGSPMIGAGLNPLTQFGIDPGTRDYFGTTIPQGNGYDMGAYEAVA